MFKYPNCPERLKGQRYDQWLPPFGLSSFPTPDELGPQLVFVGQSAGFDSWGVPCTFNRYEYHSPTHIIPCRQYVGDESKGVYVVVQTLSFKAVAL